MVSRRRRRHLGALAALVVVTAALTGVAEGESEPTTTPSTIAAPASTSQPTTTLAPPTSEAATTTTGASTTTTGVAPITTTTGTVPPVPATTAATRVGRPAPRTPWFGPTASWNRPVSDFGASSSLQPYAERLWNFGGGAAPPGTVNVAFGDYSVPVYPVTEATTSARIYQTTWSMELYGFGAPLGTKIPWNPAWHAGTGNDQLMAIVDESTGRVWELGGVGQRNVNCANQANVAAATKDNDAASVYLCVSGVRMYDNLFTAVDGSTIDGRGAGINKLALLTRADEVKAGAIRHALQMTITSTMFGQPACSPTRGASAPGAGVSCGFYLAPATKLERTAPDTGCPTTQVVTDAERSKTVPEGMRFAIRVSDAEIEQWLDARGYSGALRNTARIFAVALRDYGWIIAETGCWGMTIETDSVIGASGATWASVGVVSNGTAWPHGDLIGGLITPERLYVVEPPG